MSQPDTPAPPPDPASSAPAAPGPSDEFFVVGIGGSAGALEAFSELLKAVPTEAGIALVIVQHLGAGHESLLVDLLARVSHLPVHWAAHGGSVLPGNVYVAPAGSLLSVKQGVFILQELGGRSMSIDHFFRALAEDFKHRAVGVLLSGNGSDGVIGLRAIKAADGLTFAQEEKTAAFPSMPHAAIQSGAVDRVLRPQTIGLELGRLASESRAAWAAIGAGGGEGEAPHENEGLAVVFRLLAMRTGVDFSEYKQSTIKRRLVRRMMLAKTDKLPEYVKLLQRNRDELDQLYETLLINVTEFFRDPESFDFLREHVLPDILQKHADNSAVRIWVPGCSTGEEAYSFGILLREMLEEAGRIVPVQIFATDVSDQAIATARAGLYSPADVANVTPDRLRRFFYQTERGYVIQKPIRDMCIFARQNVAKDSPFSKLDLVSCRNLLIYLGPKLQRKLMPVFHYALSPTGYLMLGNSESVGGFSDLFRLIDRRFRVYSRKSSGRRLKFEFSLDHLPSDPTSLPKSPPAMPEEMREPYDVIREADRIVLSRHGPSGVLVNDELEILQFRGDVSAYLAPPPGRASLNLLKMAREGLAAELQAAVEEARVKNHRIHRRGVTVMHQADARQIELDVTPIDTLNAKERCFLILFVTSAELAPPAAPIVEPSTVPKAKKPVYLAQIEQLTHDLQTTRNYLQATIEKHETTNQELRAANEEIQSSNEELQSTNEELETAKEELQSTNEELTTVNEELHSRQLELMQVNNDLNNLINSVHLPIIILGQDMQIRRFTPMAEKVLNVIPTDIGRPLTDINTNLKLENLPRLMSDVLDSLTIKELEVQDTSGRWYSMRIRPYKTAENKVEGVVITLIDIEQMKRTIGELEEARNIAQAIVEAMEEPLAALNDQLQIRLANDGFCRLFYVPREDVLGRPITDFVKLDGNSEEIRRTLEQTLSQPTGTPREFPIHTDGPDGNRKELILHARQIVRANRSLPLVLVEFRRPGGA